MILLDSTSIHHKEECDAPRACCRHSRERTCISDKGVQKSYPDRVVGRHYEAQDLGPGCERDQLCRAHLRAGGDCSLSPYAHSNPPRLLLAARRALSAG